MSVDPGVERIPSERWRKGGLWDNGKRFEFVGGVDADVLVKRDVDGEILKEEIGHGVALVSALLLGGSEELLWVQMEIHLLGSLASLQKKLTRLRMRNPKRKKTLSRCESTARGSLYARKKWVTARRNSIQEDSMRNVKLVHTNKSIFWGS